MSGQSSGSSAPAPTRGQPNANRVNSSRHDQESQEIESEASANANLAQDGHLQRRHRPRSSGGFLLRTIPAPVEPDTVPDIKGKRKAEEGDLVVPKRASARQRHLQKPSLGSSPLATEVVNVHSSEHTDENGASEKTKRTSLKSSARQSMHSSLNSNGTSAGPATSTDPALPSRERSVIGHDTDATQIVNLALSLSESRRRNFSSGGLLIPRDVVGARRTISSGQQTLVLPNSMGGGSLRQHMQHQRQVSRNISPRSGKSGRSLSNKGTGSDSPHSHRDQVGRRQSTLLPDLDAGVADGFVFEASDATLSRAEKTRVAIELMYEYRRLLQYLPPIPTNSKSKLATSKDAAKNQGTASTDLGRTYNPLQYIRNRKVRFRERRPLDAEADGWKDLDRVRAWVDTIASEREDGLSRIDRRFPLPSLDTVSGEYPLAEDLKNTSVPNSAGSQSKKVGRPRMDWEFASWDLLADAHWLDQDDNFDHIEDHWGRKITADHSNRKAHTSRASIGSSSSSVRRSESLVREHASPDRVRVLAGYSRKDSKDRGRRSLDVHEPRSPLSEDNGSRDRKSRWSKKLIRSRSSSDSDDSQQESRRKQKRGRDYAGSYENLESAALEKQMMDMLAKEAEASRHIVPTPEEDTSAKADPDTRPDDRGMKDKLGQRDDKRRPNVLQRLRTDMPAAVKHSISARASLDEERLHHRRMSSDDLDLTEPNSPMAPGIVPSIAINLSPPSSPPSTVASPTKKSTSQFESSRRNRSRSVDRQAISENDPDLSDMTDLSRQTTNQSQLVNMLRKEKAMGSSNGLFTPFKSEAAGNKYRPLDGNSFKSIKSTSGSDSKLRGLFKGGRIAELVGSEVSRVGDIFGRKDNSHASKVASPASSYATSEESDMDDEDMSGLDSSPKNDLSRATTREGGGGLSRVSTNSEKPRYYMSNLPNFRSSINRHEQSPESSKSSPDHDHITRQQLAQRERGRSSRFGRLGQPKIDMRGISPSPSREASLVQPQAGRTKDEDSRHSSSSRSDRGVRSADRRLNAMLDIPGKAGTGLAPTGLAGLESKPRESSQRLKSECKRQWSISDRGVSNVCGTVNKRDIARVRALLLSSGVKANEIVRRAEDVPEKPAPFLQELEPMFKGPIPHVSRSQEPLLAARMLISSIETNIQRLSDNINDFRHTTIGELQDKIKATDQHVTFKLTPLVRNSADDADALSTELTTTHTLAIKQLNDSINIILRRRRRRLRYVRRIGWAMVEWTLLGIMWMVWLVVVIIRLIRGTISGLVKGLRWVLWL